jgi:hypothetical protein
MKEQENVYISKMEKLNEKITQTDLKYQKLRKKK